MRLLLRLSRRSFAFALPCWIMAVPLATFAQNAFVCRHQMSQGMRHGVPSHAPCWCADMTSGATLLAPEAPAVPAETAPTLGGQISTPSRAPAGVVTAPSSPSYPPTPPPPNVRAA